MAVNKRPANLGVLNKSQTLPRSMGSRTTPNGTAPPKLPSKSAATPPPIRRQFSVRSQFLFYILLITTIVICHVTSIMGLDVSKVKTKTIFHNYRLLLLIKKKRKVEPTCWSVFTWDRSSPLLPHCIANVHTYSISILFEAYIIYNK